MKLVGSRQRAEVAIIGAGLAGLTAATDLLAAGHEPVVLEARNRVGGRTLNVHLLDSTPIEIGGQWAGHDHDQLVALAASVGVEVFNGHLDGSHQFWDGAAHRFTGSTYPLARVDESALEAGIDALGRLAQVMDPQRPWDHPAAVDLDQITFDEWLRTTVETPVSRRLLQVMVESLTASPAWEYSALHAVFMVAMADGLDNLFTPELALKRRFVGGSQRISERLAEKLDGRVHLEAPVRRVVAGQDDVEVETDDDLLRVDHVIVAVPPALIPTLRLDPAAPAGLMQFHQRMLPGSVIKFLAAYPAPFWRDDGLSGWTNSLAEPLFDVLDNSPVDGHVGVLTSFAVGDAARRLAELDVDRRRVQVLARLGEFYGPAACEPTEFFELDWAAEPWTGGGYQANPTPGGWTTLGHWWARPVGPIHFAGAETSARFYGHMEGAVRSGHRAASEVAARLASTTRPG